MGIGETSLETILAMRFLMDMKPAEVKKKLNVNRATEVL